MNTDKTYNGWTNYETWVVALWIDNDEGSQGYWAERARDCWASAQWPANRSFRAATREETAPIILAEWLQREHEETLPALNGFVADLLNAAMSEVNWREIAEHLIDAVKEEEEEEEVASEA